MIAPYRYNGVSRDPWYNANFNPLTLLASAARTAATASATVINYNWVGIMVYLSISAVAGATHSLQVTVQPANALMNLMPYTTAVTAVGQYGFIFCPGCTSTPYASTPGVMQQFATALPGGGFQVTVVPANTDSVTYALYGYPIVFS